MPDSVFPVLRGAALGCALLVAFLLAWPTAAQTTASRFALAAVDDARGRATVDVGVDDFVVQEGGAAREVLDVRVADYPIVVVIDNGAAAGGDFDAIRAAVARFIERLGPRPIAIVTCGGPPVTIASFEDDRPALLAKLDAIERPASVDGQPLRGAAAAGEMIRGTGALFSAIVIATASPVEVAGPAAETFLAPVIDSRAVVHVIGNARGMGTTGSILRGLAAQAHGEFTAIYSSASYGPAIERIAARLTTELLVEYIVPPGSKAQDVRIGVRIPGARVRGLGVAPK